MKTTMEIARFSYDGEIVVGTLPSYSNFEELSKMMVLKVIFLSAYIYEFTFLEILCHTLSVAVARIVPELRD